VHLFDIDIPGKITFKESLTLTPGGGPTVVDTPAGRLGVGICYDIRRDPPPAQALPPSAPRESPSSPQGIRTGRPAPRGAGAAGAGAGPGRQRGGGGRTARPDGRKAPGCGRKGWMGRPVLGKPPGGGWEEKGGRWGQGHWPGSALVRPPGRSPPTRGGPPFCAPQVPGARHALRPERGEADHLPGCAWGWAAGEGRGGVGGRARAAARRPRRGRARAGGVGRARRGGARAARRRRPARGQPSSQPAALPGPPPFPPSPQRTLFPTDPPPCAPRRLPHASRPPTPKAPST
jgi:hypothetical protein